SGTARDVDDTAATLALHRRRHRLGAIEGAGGVHVEDGVPVGRGNLLERPPDLAQNTAGVVDEDVDAAGPFRLGPEGGDGLTVGDVDDTPLAFRAASLPRHRQLVGIEIARPYDRAGAGEGLADGVVESVTGAGHDGRSFSEIDVHAADPRTPLGS